jgi:hypothetical protein
MFHIILLNFIHGQQVACQIWTESELRAGEKGDYYYTCWTGKIPTLYNL